MALNFPAGTRVHTGYYPNFLSTKFEDRYGPGAAIGSPLTPWHIGTSPELHLDTLNELIANGKLPEKVVAILNRAGWDGSGLSYWDWMDLHMLIDFATRLTYALPIHAAMKEAFPTPPPPDDVIVISPPDTDPDPVDPEHQHSAKMPLGWKRDITYTLEVSNTRLAKGIRKLEDEGVLSDVEAHAGIEMRLRLVLALHGQVMNLPDDLRPGEPIPENPDAKGQSECDAIWKWTNDTRRTAARRRLMGYEPSARGALLGKNSFFDSQADEHLVAGLTAMSRVALALGLRGAEITYLLYGRPVTRRNSEYVLGFSSWASQDPVARDFGGVPEGAPGLNVGRG